MMSIFFSFLVSLISFSVFAGQQSEFPEFDKVLNAAGVTAQYSANSYERLKISVADKLEQVRKADKQEAIVKLLETELEKLKQVQSEGTKADQIQLYRSARALLYSVDSHLLGVQNGSKVGNVFGFLNNGKLNLPYVDVKNRANIKLIGKKAALEAYNLVNPATGHEYATPAELEGLTTDEVAQLDVRDDNTLWYSEKRLGEIKQNYGNAWNYLEQTMQKEISQKLNQEYSLDLARRVLIFEGIKTSATSPKIDTKDLFGISWKLKWAEEVHTEPIANHLYVNLGAKFADLVYANKGGPQDVILILHSEQDDANPTDCSKISTVPKLEKCLLSSQYKFGVHPYIVGSGKVTAEMLANQDLPIGKMNSEKKADLIGRTYVVFNESMVELQPPKKIAHRLGAAPFSHAGAVEDRAKRGLGIFSYWIRNKDAKDDNNRAVVFQGQQIEYMHDLGASLGNVKLSGIPNEIDDSFVNLDQTGLKIVLSMQVLYIPKAFESATMADLLWMSNKILTLSKDDILSALRSAQLPDFQVEAYLSRLLVRRDEIFSVLHGSADITIAGQRVQARLLDRAKSSPLSVPLNTPEERLQAVEKLDLAIAFNGQTDLALKHLEKAMADGGIKFSSDGQTQFQDQVLTFKAGVATTVSCQKSVLISVLESKTRPSGLSRRTARSSDEKGLAECKFRK